MLNDICTLWCSMHNPDRFCCIVIGLPLADNFCNSISGQTLLFTAEFTSVLTIKPLTDSEAEFLK